MSLLKNILKPVSILALALGSMLGVDGVEQGAETMTQALTAGAIVLSGIIGGFKKSSSN